MTATVIELYADGQPPAEGYPRHSVWMRPGEPIAISPCTFAEVQISIVGFRRIPRLVCKGRRPTRASGWHMVHRQDAVNLESGNWTQPLGFAVMARPVAKSLDAFGREASFYVEFVALIPEAAEGWPA